MPHGSESTTEELRSSPFIRDSAWQQKHRDTVLKPCTPVDIDILTSLYRREGLCTNTVELRPFVRAKHRRFVLLCFERDARIMDKILARHDIMFTLASYFEIPADHQVVNVLQ